MDWSQSLNAKITRCRQCPRLVKWREEVARLKKREFRAWDYWGKAVPSFGDPNARVLIVGLAPGAHGANRTGRMFTGDSSGKWLYRALHKAGFANQPSWEHRDDGLVLRDCYITAACHCAPPGNKPSPAEITNCNGFIRLELERMRQVRIVIALGKIAFDTYCKTQGLSPLPAFAHNRQYDLDPSLIASYHPSRQNTNTGKLTEPMFDAVFARAKRVLALPSSDRSCG
jgi:uracil-DNA glycosylase